MTLNNISGPVRSLSSSFIFAPAPPKSIPLTKFFSAFSSQKRSFSLKLNKPSPSFAAMASDAPTENISSPANVENVDVKFGFKRSEMYESSLAGTVTPYDRHIFLCYKSHHSWPARVEASDADPLPKRFGTNYKARRADMKFKTLVTFFEGSEDFGLSDGDVLVFPEMVKYRGLKESDVDGFFDDVIVNEKPWAAGVPEVLTGSYVFVCAHASRDTRCGVCGPPLIEKFKEGIESKDLKSQVFVTACSHIGGHKYAGNVLIFGKNSQGETTGHWYGYVTPEDVPELLDNHIGKGEIVERIWRGQLGTTVIEKEEKVPEQKLANGSTSNISEEKPKEKSANENSFSCCQGVNGVSCCQNGNFEAKKEQGGGARRPSNYIGKWEQRDILTTISLVGAVAAVAVAFAYYRRSR